MFPGALVSAVKATNYGPRHSDHPPKLVLHTTETSGMPAYNDGAFAPHYTFDPVTLDWWYHGVPETHRVGTLVGSRTAGVKTNELAIQVEIIAFSAKTIALSSTKRLWVGDLSDSALDELARFYTYARTFGVGGQVTPTPAGGWKYGTTAATRLTKAAWLAFNGLTAHGAVPGNTHYDTGVLDLSDIHERSMQEDDMPSPKDWTDDDWAIFKDNVGRGAWGYWIKVPWGFPPGENGNPLDSNAAHTNTVLRDTNSVVRTFDGDADQIVAYLQTLPADVVDEIKARL